MNMLKFQNVFLQITKYIYLYCKLFVSKLSKLGILEFFGHCGIPLSDGDSNRHNNISISFPSPIL